MIRVLFTLTHLLRCVRSVPFVFVVLFDRLHSFSHSRPSRLRCCRRRLYITYCLCCVWLLVLANLLTPTHTVADAKTIGGLELRVYAIFVHIFHQKMETEFGQNRLKASRKPKLCEFMYWIIDSFANEFAFLSLCS